MCVAVATGDLFLYEERFMGFSRVLFFVCGISDAIILAVRVSSLFLCS